MKADTAIDDEGGVSKQFLSDVWLQMKMLKVEVLTKEDMEPYKIIGMKSEQLTKQMQDENGRKPVMIFEEGIAGDNRNGVRELIPLPDIVINQQIKYNLTQAGIKKDTTEFQYFVDRAKKRVRLYSRAIGRILVRAVSQLFIQLSTRLNFINNSFQLHSFIREYPVSTAVMTPLFMNCKKRDFITFRLSR